MDKTPEDRNLEFSGKTAIITGAGSGIGQAITVCFAKAGAKVVIVDIDNAGIEKTISKAETFGDRVIGFRTDVTDKSGVDNTLSLAAEEGYLPDILVNSAGINGSSILVRDLPIEYWERTLSVNLTGTFLCCQAVLPFMIKKEYGKIVNIASLASSRMAGGDGSNYTASKYGLVGFSRHLAWEVASHKINVNVVSPGATRTPLMESLNSEEFLQQLEGQIPLGGLISPTDIAEAVLFLSSDRASMITGVTLDVSGGQLLGVSSDYKENMKIREDRSEASLKQYKENR